MKSSTTLRLLTLLYTFIFLFSVVEPSSFAVWLAEIIPALAILTIIWVISLRFTFSKTAYILMFIWLCLHTIGAKYTFANVPFDWFNQLIGSERNNFDRVAHFSIGLYAYPIAEYLIRQKKLSMTFSTLFALFAIMSLAASYEIIEWWYAALAGGDEGIAFLGSQGDVWDAQKDMLCDTLGAVTALLLLATQRRLVKPS
ncbi:hypothetical protein BS333_17665 [Vibrio azureus]|uniref:Inner membrane protein YjdF n=1 Tax=Vibrio azureus NBRC 104587 TaxID=1219077 RepID=U3C916_9VIBR|nr:DUF2238 domain-containing protein [Vibrio azureus]AUI88186.1 hypothetical protein BS333_17665 [Vibrio azureus]GAD74918.1 hypothetical protein VAZ01S_017_00130 [Vibrio azureus NBRC 104587]